MNCTPRLFRIWDFNDMKESEVNRQDNEYYLFGDRPVKWVSVEGHPARQVLKYDWDTGFFVLGQDYLQKILFGKDDIDELTEAEFINATETLRRQDFDGDNAVFALYQVVEPILKNAQSDERPLSAEENALIASIYRKTYPLFEEVSIIFENYWPKALVKIRQSQDARPAPVGLANGWSYPRKTRIIFPPEAVIV